MYIFYTIQRAKKPAIIAKKATTPLFETKELAADDGVAESELDAAAVEPVAVVPVPVVAVPVPVEAVGVEALGVEALGVDPEERAEPETLVAVADEVPLNVDRYISSVGYERND